MKIMKMIILVWMMLLYQTIMFEKKVEKNEILDKSFQVILTIKRET